MNRVRSSQSEYRVEIEEGGEETWDMISGWKSISHY